MKRREDDIFRQGNENQNQEANLHFHSQQFRPFGVDVRHIAIPTIDLRILFRRGSDFHRKGSVPWVCIRVLFERTPAGFEAILRISVVKLLSQDLTMDWSSILGLISKKNNKIPTELAKGDIDARESPPLLWYGVFVMSLHCSGREGEQKNVADQNLQLRTLTMHVEDFSLPQHEFVLFLTRFAANKKGTRSESNKKNDQSKSSFNFHLT